eukprot:6352745-Prymnesium_polylepis.1
MINKRVAVVLERGADESTACLLGRTDPIVCVPPEQRGKVAHSSARGARRVTELEIRGLRLPAIISDSHVEHRACKVTAHAHRGLEAPRIFSRRRACLRVSGTGTPGRAVVKVSV